MYKDIEREVEQYISKNGKSKLDEKIFELCVGQPDYVYRNLLLKYIWDVEHSADFAYDMFRAMDDQITISHTKFLLISGLEKLDNEKVEFLRRFVSINMRNIKTCLKLGLELNVSDLVCFTYNKENDSYSCDASFFNSFLNNEVVLSLQEERDINLKRLQEIRDMFRKNSHLMNFGKIISSVKAQQLLESNVDYKTLEKDYYDALWTDADSVHLKKEIICQRYFNESFRNVENLLDKISYSKGKRNIKDYIIIKSLLENEDLDFTYEALDNSFRKLYRNLYFSYIKYCCNDIADSLEKYDERKSILRFDNNVYDLTNEDFTLLIHRTNAFVDRSSKPDVDFVKSPIEDGRMIISCSLISDLYLGRVIEDKEGSGVYFGFNSIEAKDIADMGPKDIFSSELIGNNVPMSVSGNNYFDTENLLLNSFEQYNEICIFREDQYTRERVKPDFIVCFDKVDDYSKEIANKLNLPIYFLNTNMVFENGRRKLRDMVEDDNNFKDSEENVKLLKRLLSFAYSAMNRETYELDKNLLNEFIVKTRNCSIFPKSYIDTITKYALRLNKGLGKESCYEIDAGAGEAGR